MFNLINSGAKINPYSLISEAKDINGMLFFTEPEIEILQKNGFYLAISLFDENGSFRKADDILRKYKEKNMYNKFCSLWTSLDLNCNRFVKEVRSVGLIATPKETISELSDEWALACLPEDWDDSKFETDMLVSSLAVKRQPAFY